jgi:hypothetical protein
MLRIIVIGNCTSRVVGNCLRVLRPRDRITIYFPERDSVPATGEAGRKGTDRLLRPLMKITPHLARRVLHLPVRTAKDLAQIKFDYAFASAHLDGNEILKSVRSRTPLMFWPNLVFPGYHPDCTYLSVDGRPVHSPMGDYHSRIVAAAYAAGLMAGETARLFNKLVYVRLGYLKQFALAKSALARDFDRHGYDLASVERDWVATGAFMYTINHPKLAVCAVIARQLLSKAGLDFRNADLGEEVRDDLAAMPQWPVYPEVAEMLGIPGSTDFKTPVHNAFAGRVLSLSQYIEGSFERYRVDGFDRASFAREEGISALVKTIGL